LPQHAIIQQGSISLDRNISEIDVVSGTATGRTRKIRQRGNIARERWSY
jgi:hypothetical protein